MSGHASLTSKDQVNADSSPTNSQGQKLVWITGAGGLIGSYIARGKPHLTPDWRSRALARVDLDLTDFKAVGELFSQERPHAIIHCAALSRSPECQENPSLAWRLNVEVTRHLAELAAGIPFIFFSSDLVFDGERGGYSEEDAPNPLSVYAETKVAAERDVLRNPRHTVIRTSLNGGVSRAGNRGFNEELRNAWKAGKELALFVDEFRAPLPAVITSRVVWQLLSKQAAGIYHVAGGERLSRYEIGMLIAARWPELRPRIRAASIREYQGPARPPDTSLKCGKVEALLDWRLPGLGAWLEAHPNEVF